MDLTVTEYFNKMTEGMSIFQKAWFIVTDTLSAFGRLSFFDGLVYGIILLFAIVLVFWIVLFAYLKMVDLKIYMTTKKDKKEKTKERKDKAIIVKSQQPKTAKIIQFKPRK